MARCVASLVFGLCLAATCGVPRAEASPEQDLLFRVMLDDREIGYHRFRISPQEGREVVEIDAGFKVTFLAIPVYRYNHTNREIWRQGCLESIVSATDDDGDEFAVEGRRTQRGFEVATRDGVRQIESACVMSFAYWNRDFLQQNRLLNSQNGEYLAIDVEAGGRGELKLPDREVAASSYRLRNTEEEIDITVWYDRDSGRWLSLESRVEGGRVIRYLPAGADEFDAPGEQTDSGSPDTTGTRK